jgi:secretion/DNA translocation related TadE-like protein
VTDDERGAASLVVAALAGLVLLIGLAAAFLTATAAAHRKAQAAADLAALAGATAHQNGAPACDRAGLIALRNGARLTGCQVERDDVVVRVEVVSPRFLGYDWEIVGRARAGPG